MEKHATILTLEDFVCPQEVEVQFVDNVHPVEYLPNIIDLASIVGTHHDIPDNSFMSELVMA